MRTNQEKIPFKVDRRIIRLIAAFIAVIDKPSSKLNDEIKHLIPAFVEGEEVGLQADENTASLLNYLDAERLVTANIGLKSIESPTGPVEVISALDVQVVDADGLEALYERIKYLSAKQLHVSFRSSGALHLGKEVVQFRVGTPAYQVLRQIFKSRDSRERIWGYGDAEYGALADQVDIPENNMTPSENLRSIGNYINKRVREKTEINNFLIVTTVELRLNLDFV